MRLLKSKYFWQGAAVGILILIIGVWGYAAPPPGETPHSVAEEDGTPTVWFPYQIKVTDGTLTDNADGTVSISVGAGDVESVGDCTTGACLDGTADGGTEISIYDGDSNKTTISMADAAGDLTFVLPADDGDNLEVLHTDGAGNLDWSTDDSAGSTAWDDIGNPDNNGLSTITFDNAELSLFTGDNDAAASFFTIQNTDGDHTGGEFYLLDLDFSADDGDPQAQYLKLQDSGGVVMTIHEDGNIATNGYMHMGVIEKETIDVNGTTKEIQLGVHGADVANTYVSFMDRASDTHSPTLVIARARGDHGAKTQVADDDIIGQIGFMGWDGTDSDLNFGGIIRVRVHGAAGNNDLPTEIVLGVAPDGAATPTEQITLYDGVLSPITDDDIDLGTATEQFKDAFIDGTLEADAITEGGNAVSNDTEIEAVVEPLIDTLANLSSAGGQPVAFADAGADAFWGWDDAGGAQYENLTDAEALAIIGGTANDFDASGDVTVAMADVSDLSFEMSKTLEDPVEADDDIPFWHPHQAITITDVYCECEGATSIGIIISDGTNALEEIICDQDGQADDGSIANGTFSADERMEVDMGTITDTPDWVSWTITYTID